MRITDASQRPLPDRVLHLKSRTQKPAIYPARFPVPDEKVSWAVSFPDYKPLYFVAPTVIKNDRLKNPDGWADPEDLDGQRPPINPRGRTGIRGRGLLGKWGANFAADPLITRNNPTTGQMEMLVIKRKDTGEWAIPGGMVDAGEVMSATASRELGEETGVKIDMKTATEIYRGYADDPRNTDNAWMETVVMHKHLETEEAARVKPIAGDDAADVKWLPLTEEHIGELYASHADFVRLMLART